VKNAKRIEDKIFYWKLMADAKRYLVEDVDMEGRF